MPDWLNPDDYQFSPETTSLTEWAWEFLRRNPGYQQDYARFREQVRDLKGEFGPDWKKQPQAREYDPPKKPGESEQAWMLRCAENGEMARKLPLEQWYAKKWGLRGRMGNPEEELKPFIGFAATTSYPRRIEILEAAQDLFEDMTIGITGGQEMVIRKGIALIAFDLNTPIKGQITKAKKLLSASKTQKAIKVKSIHKFIDLWVTYLRALDGLAARVAKGKIAKSLGYDPVKGSTVTAPMKGYDLLDAAIRLRDIDYRYIVSDE